jgi:hypothetical protein
MVNFGSGDNFFWGEALGRCFLPFLLDFELASFFCLFYPYFFFIQGLLLGPLKLLRLWRGLEETGL